MDSAFPHVLAIHVPNETRSAKDAYFAKQKGTRAGTSDWLFWWRGDRGAIEMKPPGEKLRTNQNKFLSALAATGAKTGVCYSVREMHNMLKSWGITPKHEAIIEPDYTTKEEKQKMMMDMYRP